MFAPISAIFSLLFFASTLPNGIRLVELPSEGDNLEIVAGYSTGGLAGFASTPAFRSLVLDAYAAGADINFIEEQDRTGVRITAPKWTQPMLLDRLPALFKDAGDVGAAPTSPIDFRAKVEEEIRNALLGPDVPSTPYATTDAFVLVSVPPPATLRDALAGIPRRGSSTRPDGTLTRLPAERTLRFKSDLAEGAVIFASPIPGAYYKQWYLVLVLDRLIHKRLPFKVSTSFPLTALPYYYRVEVPVPSGQFPEPIEENLIQELQRLQFAPASARDLAASRDEAVAYLNSKAVREWFASYDITDRREEGIDWIQAMTADDLRVATRDLLIMNRVVATWSPRPRQASVTSEPLSSASTNDRASKSTIPNNSPRAAELGSKESVIAFPSHTDSATVTGVPERLSSGISLVESTINAVFVSGVAMMRFDRELTAEDLRSFQQYRPDRILVLVPAASISRARSLWTNFKGATTGDSRASRGKVSNNDLAALVILKTILDLKVIESGWWPDATLRIDASAGTDLQIRASEDQRAQILEWTKRIAGTPLPESYFAWVREVAVHRFSRILPDLQALTWERDPQGVPPNPETVSLMHLQDVARIYF